MKKPCFFLLLAWGTVFALIIPSDRRITWEGNVGIPGGVPNRTVISATITASTYGNGATDATDGIQTALDNCPASQVVFLSAGTFRINSILRIPDNVTLRGAGPSNYSRRARLRRSRDRFWSGRHAVQRKFQGDYRRERCRFIHDFPRER